MPDPRDHSTARERTEHGIVAPPGDIHRAIEAGAGELAAGNLLSAVKSLRLTGLTAAELRDAPALRQAAEQGVGAALHRHDTREAERILTVFALAPSDHPALYRTGERLVSPRLALPKDIIGCAEEMTNDLVDALRNPDRLKSERFEGYPLLTHSFMYDSITTRNALEVYLNPNTVAMVEKLGQRTPFVTALIRPGFSTASIRTQVAAKSYADVVSSLNGIAQEFVATTFHELCHLEQELYRRAHPERNAPAIDYGCFDSPDEFIGYYLYLPENSDEIGAHLAESAFVAKRNGEPIEVALERAVATILPKPVESSPLTLTEHSILQSVYTELLHRAAQEQDLIQR